MNMTQADRDFAKLLFLISEIERRHPDTAFTIGVVSKEEFDFDQDLQPTDQLVGIAMVAEWLYLANSPEIPNFGKCRAALPKITEFVSSLPSYVDAHLDGQLHFFSRTTRNLPEMSGHEKMEVLRKAKEICEELA